MDPDVYVTHSQKDCIKYNNIYNFIDPKKIVECKRCVLMPEDKTIYYDRKGFGFGDSDFLIVSVGRRLNFEINNDMIEKFSILLEKNPRMRWLIVGNPPSSSNKLWVRQVSSGQIILWGFEEHIDALYRICDVFLQPKRIGGGHSMRQAMRQGLPVAITDYPSGVLSIFDSDEVVHGGYEELSNYVEKLFRDDNFYQERSDRMRNLIRNISMGNDAVKLEDVYRRMKNENL